MYYALIFSSSSKSSHSPTLRSLKPTSLSIAFFLIHHFFKPIKPKGSMSQYEERGFEMENSGSTSDYLHDLEQMTIFLCLSLSLRWRKYHLDLR